MNKITVIGAGRVGESTAQFLAAGDMCRELALIDVREGAAEGVALDIQEFSSLYKFDTRLSGSSDPKLMADSDFIIITAGMPRKPGMSRSDVLETNVRIIDEIVENAVQYAPDSMMLLVTNPVDVLTYRAWKKSGWARERVFGQAGVLDSSRMASFISMETGYSAQDINTMVLGGHGDSMVPLIRYTSISGIPVTNFLSAEQLDKIIERTRNGGAEILSLRGSSAYDAPAASVARMVDAIVHDRHRILPTVAILDGEYGNSDMAIGVPAVLGRSGMEKIIPIELDDTERPMFDHSVSNVRSDLEKLSNI